MRSCAALLLLCAVAAFGDGYDWVRSSRRYENPLLVDLLLESDLDSADAVVAALSERTDRYVEDIIEGLLYQHSPRARLVLSSFLIRLSDGWSRDGAPAPALWAAENPRAARLLVEELPRLRDGHARAAVLRLLPHAGLPSGRAVIASRLAAIAGGLEASGGHAAGGDRRELFAALDAARLAGGAELAAGVIRIAFVSRDAEAVTRARRVAEELLGDDLAQ